MSKDEELEDWVYLARISRQSWTKENPWDETQDKSGNDEYETPLNK